MKIPVFLVALFLSSFLVTAKEVQIEKARIVAKNLYTERNPELNFQVNIADEFEIDFNETLVYYVFNLNPGFVIISADDNVYPILGYSFEASYSGVDFPPAFQSWMDHYAEQIYYSINEGISPAKEIDLAWEKYSDIDFKADIILDEVDPLILTTWSQGCYYNSQMPADTNGPCDHLYTGCVATAMGQIMKFYNWPQTGTGSNSYNTPYGLQEADFENTTYDWLNMNYHLELENQAVAGLLYHCTVSINSILTPNGTGAYDFDVRDALVDYFKYDDNAQFHWRDSYAGDWKEMLRIELDEGRPLIYGGADSQTNAGHTLVCDGYQDTAFFHFNWGWAGFYNGYYYIDSLIASGSHFDFQHDAIVGIKPDITEQIELYPPENLMANVNVNEVILTWQAATWPGNLELLGYNIYRNNQIVNPAIVPDLEFTEHSVPSGTHEYKVNAVYIGQEGSDFILAEVFVEGNSILENEIVPFIVYPNPASDHIIIEFVAQDHDCVKCSIVDLNGKSVLLFDCNLRNRDHLKLELPNMSKGIYLIKLETDSNVFSKKLLVN